MKYLEPLFELFEANANPENAVQMAKYMKNKFAFLGIKKPLRSELMKQFYNKNGYPKISELKEICRTLWTQPYREYQYAADGMLHKFRRDVDKSFIALYEYLIVTKSWWDTVDALATQNVGVLFQRFPEMSEKYSPKWIDSQNIWLKRTALLFQLDYKEKTDVELLFKYIKKCAAHKDFFIRKAIGWVLREYSKTDAQIVIEFVKNNELSPLSKREALKWLKNKGKI
ncbi:MAG: DNA alkylation repair protein [Candidatus Cloacimonetes bacterium]|nr:DNA alkylation repair protein [Candidatus Cloacimonadota bacterium]